MHVRLVILCLSLLVCACGARTSAMRARGFVRVETRDVILRTDVDAARAQWLAARLQRMHEYFDHRLFPCAHGIERSRVQVVGLSHGEDLSSLAGDVSGYYVDAPVSWLEPLIVIEAGSIDEGRDVRVFNHELSHRATALCYPRAPTWLNEGIAELFETLRQVDDRRVVLGYPGYVFAEGWDWVPDQVMRLSLPRDELPSLSALRAMPVAAFYGDGQPEQHRTLHYAAAWSAVHLLEIGDPALHARFGRYLHALRHSDTPEDLLWDMSFDGVDLDAALRAYQRRSELRFVYDELPPAEDTRPPAVSVISEEEGHLLWAELRLRRGQVELANEHLLAARGAQARARLLGGTMSLLLGHRDEARRAFDAAVASDPDLAAASHARAVLASEGELPGPQVERVVERLGALASTADDFALLAWIELHRGNTEAAIDLAGRGIRENRLSWRALRALGRAYLVADRPDRAIGPLQAALPLLPDRRDPRTRREMERELAGARAALRAPPDAVVSMERPRTGEGPRRCYEALLREQPDARGVVVVRLTVRASGIVGNASVVRSEIASAALERCIETAARGWTFSPPGGRAELELDFELAPEPAGRRPSAPAR